MTLISIPVACPRCNTKGGQDMRPVEPADPRMNVRRERRLVLECPRCNHVATLVVHLVDGLVRREAS